MVRVLRPGGTLLVTNRIGWQATMIFGHTTPRASLMKRLAGLGLTDVRIEPWQVEYDLAWAVKA
jgi:hypothetical protein